MSVVDSAPEAASPAPRRRHRRPGPRWGRIVALVVVVLVVLGVGWYELQAHPIGGPGAPETIQVTSGEAYSSVAANLAQKGVISDGIALKIFNLIHGTPTVLPGFYTLPKNSTYQAAHDVLGAGPNTAALVVPPGFTLREVVLRLDSVAGKSFASSVNAVLTNGSVRSPFEPAGSTDLEGLIAPGTYLLPPGATPSGLVHDMVNRFVALAASSGLTPTTTRGSLDAYSLITVASVVEKEGYIVKNMDKVSTVIFNRLAANMPLQMDSTVLYALNQDGGPVTHATETYQSPYNTYLNHGLPPTPICTPSASALNATMHPTPGTWLYFTVVDKSGTEAFSTTFDQQLANEKLAQERGL